MAILALQDFFKKEGWSNSFGFRRIREVTCRSVHKHPINKRL